MEEEKLTPEEVERRLTLMMNQFRLVILEQVMKATEKGDFEDASRWAYLLNTVCDIMIKVQDRYPESET